MFWLRNKKIKLSLGILTKVLFMYPKIQSTLDRHFKNINIRNNHLSNFHESMNAQASVQS